MSFDNAHHKYRYDATHHKDDEARHFLDVWMSPTHSLHGLPLLDHQLSVHPQVPTFQRADNLDQPSPDAWSQRDIPSLPSFQTLDIATFAHPDTTTWHNYGVEMPSPSLSDRESSYIGSATSDTQSTPLSPPETAFMAFSPQIMDDKFSSIGFGGGVAIFNEQGFPTSYPCVAMQDVQAREDLHLERFAYNDNTGHYDSYASATHEGYEPLAPAEDESDEGADVDDDIAVDEGNATDEDYTPPSPNLRRRRPQTTRTLSSPRTIAKVTKRGTHARRSSGSSARKTSSMQDGQTGSMPNRTFACALAPYGCRATFGSKNEWKRHVNTQHMRLGYWRCDQCVDKKEPNDFNRKDLFIQHVRRMHPLDTTSPPIKRAPKQTMRSSGDDEQILTALADRCFKQLRLPPTHSGCHFCEATFEEDDDACQTLWDKRLEHIAHHMGAAKKSDSSVSDPARWQLDARFERWLVGNGIVKRNARGELVLA